MSDSPEEATRRNMGWFYMDALRYVAKRGRWPDSLTTYERRRLRAEGIVKLVYVSGVGWQPRLDACEQPVDDDHR